jgi:glycosyltransferase involved in cell wall biosynthesis
MQEVCIVIPCFNEEKRLKRREILDFLHTHQSAAVCFVDDGSSDGTAATLGDIRRSAPQSVLVLELPVNGGKAEAVRRGMLHAACSRRFSLIGYWDADMSTPLRELATMLDVFAHDPGCKVVMGSRVRRLGSTIQRSAARHYLGRVFSTLASLLLKLPVYDSQCGAKLVRAELVDVLFSERFLT